MPNGNFVFSHTRGSDICEACIYTALARSISPNLRSRSAKRTHISLNEEGNANQPDESVIELSARVRVSPYAVSVLVRLGVWASVPACLLSLHLFDYLVLVSCESYKRLLNIDILCFTISLLCLCLSMFPCPCSSLSLHMKISFVF